MSSSGRTSALVLAERRGPALVLTLNRPEAGNAISRDVAEALNERLHALRAAEGLRAVVVTGSGTRYFCTGGDVKAYSRMSSPEELERVFGLMRDACDALERLDMPVIAAVNGYAVGGGAELMLSCDLRIASPSARIGFPQCRLGIMPGWDGTERLLRIAGHSSAAQLLFSGDLVDATRAERLGIVDEIHEAPLERALALAGTFCAAAPLSLRAIKTALLDAAGPDRAGARARARQGFAKLWFTADHKEAERAFAEKRAARFNGS